MALRWNEPVDVTTFDTGEGMVYELWYSFGFDTLEEANDFANRLDSSDEFKALIKKIAQE